MKEPTEKAPREPKTPKAPRGIRDPEMAKQAKTDKPPRERKIRRRILSMNARNTLEAYTFISPFILGTLVFFVFPIGLLIVMTFTQLKNPLGLQLSFSWNMMFDNIMQILFGKSTVTFFPTFIQALKDMAIRVPLTIIFAMIIALLINKKIRFRGFFRTVFFLPFLLGNGYVMQQLMAQDVTGRAIQSAQNFFLPPTIMQYLGTTLSGVITAVFSVVIVIFWGCGVQILLFLSGLQGISPSYYEAARVESANEWECFWHITLPMMSPVLLLCIVYSLVDSFTNITNPVQTYITNMIQGQNATTANFTIAAAASLMYSLFVLLLVGLVFLIMRNFMFTTETRGGKVK
ncbi:MAG: sugar ABC transporter permease [Oscillospiraceae bacterium]|nr:sugar ABC transporter permease [Oscillospiraceae bacterium]